MLKAEKKVKKKKAWTFLVSYPPKTANTRKDIYLFIYLINWETGFQPLFAALDFIFLCSHLPPPKKPLPLLPWLMRIWHATTFAIKKKKTIWDGKLYGTLAPQGQWLFGPSSVAQRSSVLTGWVGYPLVFCHLALGNFSTSLAWSLVSSVSCNGFLFLPSLPTNPKRGTKSTFRRWRRLCCVFYNRA